MLITKRGRSVDRRDVAIFREMSRDKVIWWGSSDPRISAAIIGKRLRLPSSTVRDRLRAWKRSGFLAATEVVPNPLLFGAQLAGTSIRTAPAAKAGLIKDLRLIEPALTAMDLVGPWLALVVANPNPRMLESTRQLISKLPDVEEVAPCMPVGVPACSVEPTALDWRILATVRQYADASITQAAQRVRVSTRTFTRRYEALIAARAVYVVPMWDFTRLEGTSVVRFVVSLRSGVDHNAASRAIWSLRADLMEVFTPGATTPGAQRDWIEVWAPLANAASTQDMETILRGLPGVEDVTPYFPSRFISYPGWFDARLEEKVQANLPPKR